MPPPGRTAMPPPGRPPVVPQRGPASVEETTVIPLGIGGGVDGAGRRLFTQRAVEMTRWIPRIREQLRTEPEPEARPAQPVAPNPFVLRLVGALFGPTFLVSSVLYWLASLQKSSTANVNDYGMLAVMHPTFFVAVAVCVFGFLVE